MKKIPGFYTVYLFCRVELGLKHYQKLSGGYTSRAAAENYIHEYIMTANGKIPRTEFCVQLYASSPAPALIAFEEKGLTVSA